MSNAELKVCESGRHPDKKKFRKCGTVNVEGHTEVSMVYRIKERKSYNNSIAEPEANVIVLR